MGKDTQDITSASTGNLRWQHYEEDELIHIHDDDANIKFIHHDVAEFKKEVQGCLDDLKNQEGIALLRGSTKVDLVLLQYDKKLMSFLSARKSVKKDIQKFIKGL